MRFSTVAAVAAATAPIAVSAKGKLGFSLGVRKAGQTDTRSIKHELH